MHLGFRDRMSLLGDPDFVDVPLDYLLSKEYAAKLRNEINAELARRGTVRDPLRVSETTHTSAMDVHIR